MKNECDDAVKQKDVNEEKLGIWVLTYTNTLDFKYRGIGVVRAHDAGEAERVFLSQSMHNANQQKIKINKLYQVEDSFIPTLIGEEYLKVV